MRSPLRALLVAVVTMLGVMLVCPSLAEAKSVVHKHTKTTTRTTTTKTTTKRVVKHPWKKHHAKTHAAPHRARKSGGHGHAKHPWSKKG